MRAFEKNKTIWSEIYNSGRNNLSYPNENLVRYIYHLFSGKDVTKMKLLDYGFGSGNNLKYLFDFGFDIYGVEVSESAKQIALAKLGGGFDSNRLFLMNIETILPFQRGYFDVVIAWQVLYYNSFESLVRVLKTINGLLKPGGVFISTMPRMQDISVTNSLPLNNYEREMNGNMGNQSGSIVLALPTEEDIHRVFNEFVKRKIGYFETKINDIVASHWVIYGEKNND
jgi:SAM-dependent methyltransferase